MLCIKDIKRWKKLDEYSDYHVHTEDAKTFVTIIGIGIDECELPIIGMEERKVSSRCLLDTYEEEKETIYNVVFLKYTENITEETVNEAFTAKEIMSMLLSKDDDTILVAVEENENLNVITKDTWINTIININPTDDFDCRSKKMKNLLKNYHTVGFMT